MRTSSREEKEIGVGDEERGAQHRGKKEGKARSSSREERREEERVSRRGSGQGGNRGRREKRMRSCSECPRRRLSSGEPVHLAVLASTPI